MNELVWNTGGMIATGENRNTRRKLLLNATPPNTNPTRTGLESNPGIGRGMALPVSSVQT